MAATVQWTVELDESLLHALRLRAAQEGGEPAAVLDALLRQALAAEIEELSGAVPLAAMIQQVVRRGGPVRSSMPQVVAT